MRLFFIFIAFITWTAAASANNQAPVIYAKTLLTIVPKPATAKVKIEKPIDKKEEADSKPSEVLPQLPRVTKEFLVEVRPMQFLLQSDFIAHQPFTDQEGMLIVVDPPQFTLLKSGNMLAKTDVLFVAEDGLITQIAPSISLAELAEPITSETAVHAFLFLKAEAAKTSDIRPGDHIRNALFKTRPVILEAPTESAKPTPQK